MKAFTFLQSKKVCAKSAMRQALPAGANPFHQ
jgi:hypothetical protein